MDIIKNFIFLINLYKSGNFEYMPDNFKVFFLKNPEFFFLQQIINRYMLKSSLYTAQNADVHKFDTMMSSVKIKKIRKSKI